MTSMFFPTYARKLEPLQFPILFGLTFLLLYGFNLGFIGLTTKGGQYLAFLDNHLNYIKLWRSITIETTGGILKFLGYQVSESHTQLQVYKHGGFNLIYSCLGYGMMSVFTAFVINYPSVAYRKIKFLLKGLILIQCLNILRFVALSLSWRAGRVGYIDHHLLFNCCVYIILSAKIYFYTKKHNHNPI
jgi:exosortase/archaeosortase family protein